MREIKKIINLYELLINIQLNKTPGAIQGLKIQEAKWIKLLNKVNADKKLTKLENTMVQQIEFKEKHLNDYINLVEKD